MSVEQREGRIAAQPRRLIVEAPPTLVPLAVGTLMPIPGF
jgi:hypothetical protein